jgi:peroxiredoxin/tetratricopeptide (TPR) repeat protein
MSFKPTLSLLTFAALMLGGSVRAQDTQDQPAASPAAPVSVPTPGHSGMGEAFNEGPRQKAYLMKGMANVHFPVTTKSSLAQKFFDQGVSQLHGFWYFESERSFRQVNAIDPDCVMAYWGMAMSNVYNDKRAKEFITKALENKAKVSAREQMWIDALSKLYEDNPSDKSAKGHHLAYLHAMNGIIRRYPDDIEARAFQEIHVYENQYFVPMFSRGGMEYALNLVLAANPMHPAHHYRIHLWDGGKAEKALNSAALCGQSSPGIAHMWHMPGHIYSDLKRYTDASWQQEAGVRTDNAQLIRNRLMPDEIFNYAHNSEWLIRDLSNVGRVHDAITLAKNMIEMPRHPNLNTIAKGGTGYYGRLRLMDLLLRYEMWDDLLEFGSGLYVEPTDVPHEQVRWNQYLGIAHFMKGDMERGEKRLAALEALVQTDFFIKEEETRKAEALKNKVKLTPGVPELALTELRAYRALAQGKSEEALRLLGSLQYFPKERLAAVYLRIGNLEKAEQLAKEAVAERKNEVQPLAAYVDSLYRRGNKIEAEKQLKQLQSIAGSADLDVPIFRRISAIAPELGSSGSWRVENPPAADVGKRPRLDSLGPFCWTPSAAPQWTLTDSTGHRVSLQDYTKKGKPVLVIFYLGSLCKQCMEQLNIFAPVAKKFEEAGISLVAISTDSVEGLRKTFPANGSEPGFPFPLVSDRGQKTFKAYRAYDDFEKMPLHGTFLVDGQGLVRWQDISYQPFKETSFLLEEAKRLLRIPGAPSDASRVARKSPQQVTTAH